MTRLVLVTGGAGFIGSHLVDELIARGHQVRVLDNLRNGSLENLSRAKHTGRLEFVQGDVTDLHTSEQVVAGVHAVYHLACLGVRHSLHSPLENARVNSLGTLSILEACKKQGVSRFVYVSTSEIYGRVRDFPISEEAIPCPITVYGSSKLAAEFHAYSYGASSRLHISIVRMFNNYGPRAHFDGDSGELIPRSIVRVLLGKSPVIFGDGNVTRDFIFVKDSVAALCFFLDADTPSGGIYNIGSGVEISVREIMERLLKEMNSAFVIKHLDGRPADVPRLWVDSSKFKSISNFIPSYSLDKGLKETISYYRTLGPGLKDVEEINWIGE